MNVQKGDMAIIVRSSLGNEGMLVEVGEFYGMSSTHPHLGECWWVTSLGSPLKTASGHFLRRGIFPDARLRPISPGALDDETTATRELEINHG